MNPEMIRYEK